MEDRSARWGAPLRDDFRPHFPLNPGGCASNTKNRHAVSRILATTGPISLPIAKMYRIFFPGPSPSPSPSSPHTPHHPHPKHGAYPDASAFASYSGTNTAVFRTFSGKMGTYTGAGFLSQKGRSRGLRQEWNGFQGYEKRASDCSKALKNTMRCRPPVRQDWCDKRDVFQLIVTVVAKILDGRGVVANFP